MYMIQSRDPNSGVHTRSRSKTNWTGPATHTRVRLWSIPMVVVNRRHRSDRKKENRKTGKARSKKQTKKNINRTYCEGLKSKTS